MKNLKVTFAHFDNSTNLFLFHLENDGVSTVEVQMHEEDFFELGEGFIEDYYELTYDGVDHNGEHVQETTKVTAFEYWTEEAEKEQFQDYLKFIFRQ